MDNAVKTMSEKSTEIRLLNEIEEIVDISNRTWPDEKLYDLQNFLTIARAATRNLREDIEKSNTIMRFEDSRVAKSLSIILGQMEEIAEAIQSNIVENTKKIYTKCEALRLCLEGE